MNPLIKKMFKKDARNTPMYFEALSGQLPQLLKRPDIIRHGKKAVSQSGFTGSPMERIPILKKLTMLPTGLKMYNQIKKSLIIPQRKAYRTQITNSELDGLKAYLDQQGITSYGFVKVDHDNIFKDRGIFFDNAIVISIQMPVSEIAKAPSFETMVMIEDTYAQTGEIVNKIASYIRDKGFGAQAGPGLGGMTNYPLLAREAGMGEFGKSGILITPESGPSHRLAAVYTSINNFPLKEIKEHQWVSDYCNKCGLCIKKCPGNAIHDQPTIVNEKHIAHIDYDKCMSCFNENFGCSVCIKVCPFTKSGYEKLHSVYSKNIAKFKEKH